MTVNTVVSTGAVTANAPTTRLAVVLAAGEGSRVSELTRSAPKASLRVLGVPIAQRLLTALDGVGIERVIVVLGCRADATRMVFTRAASHCAARVDFVVCENWRLGNGASALPARDAVGDESFVLVMADHVFDGGLVRQLCCTRLSNHGFGVGIDRGTATLFDRADATKVLTRPDGSLIAIGKLLELWNAVDVGAHFATSTVFSALDRAFLLGRHSLSDAIALLARDGRAVAIELTGYRWADIDTLPALRDAERRFGSPFATLHPPTATRRSVG